MLTAEECATFEGQCKEILEDKAATNPMKVRAREAYKQAVRLRAQLILLEAELPKEEKF